MWCLVHDGFQPVHVGEGVLSVGVEVWKKSTARRRVVPYTSSADVQWRSPLRVERIPNKAIGSASNQLVVAALGG